MPKPSKKKTSRALHSYLIPHKGNGYRPHLFGGRAVAVILLLLALFEGAYLLDIQAVQKQGEYAASVLPAVLADLTNADRSANNLKALTVDADLSRAAQLKANDMAANGYFAHVSPEGKTPWYWLKQVGYKYSYAGENLAVNFDDSKNVEDAWMASPTHRANIVKPQYTRVGYGIANGTYEGKETTFVVQVLAMPADAAPAPVKKPVADDSTPVVSVPVDQTAETEVVPDASPVAVATDDVSNPAEVLGAQSPVPAPGIFASLAASPESVSEYVLGFLSLAFLVLLIVAIYVHMRIQYVEVLGGGALVFAVALALLVFNVSGPSVKVPEGTQTAAVVGAF